MLVQLRKVIAQLEAMQVKAEDYEGSESERTAEKYDGIADMIGEAIDALNNAADQLDI